jgi:hypothetical protein
MNPGRDRVLRRIHYWLCQLSSFGLWVLADGYISAHTSSDSYYPRLIYHVVAFCLWANIADTLRSYRKALQRGWGEL